MRSLLPTSWSSLRDFSLYRLECRPRINHLCRRLGVTLESTADILANALGVLFATEHVQSLQEFPEMRFFHLPHALNVCAVRGTLEIDRGSVHIVILAVVK